MPEIGNVAMIPGAARDAPSVSVEVLDLVAAFAVEDGPALVAGSLRYTLLDQGLPPWSVVRGVTAPPGRFLYTRNITFFLRLYNVFVIRFVQV